VATPGTTLQDRYLIERLLDCSPFGDLYLARDRRTKQDVDVKAITHIEPDTDTLFAREAAAFAAVRHVALPAVVDMFATVDGRFLVFDHIPGLTLEDIRTRHAQGRLSADAAIRLIQPVLDALNRLHQHTPRLIHRDVRPPNIRVTPAGQVYLTNPGIAGRSGMPFAADDPRIDLYGIGATLYTLLTGNTPPAPNERLQRDPLPPVQRLRPDLSNDLAQVIHRLLSLDPAHQYASAADASRDLIQAAPDVTCTRCSTTNRASARFCRSCGAPLPASDPRSAIRALIERLPAQPPDASTGAAPPSPPAPPRPDDAPTITTPPPSPHDASTGAAPLRPPAPPSPPAPPRPDDAPTITTPPPSPHDASTGAAPPRPTITTPPSSAAAPPIAAPVGDAQRQRGRLIGGIVAAVVLLAACLGGGFLVLRASGLIPAATAISGVSPAPASPVDARTPASGGSAATAEARQNATATAIAAIQQATATARINGQTATAQAGQAIEVQTATAIARQTVAAAAQQTAAAIAAATQTAAVPTATPTPQFLQPQPGVLSLADYQAQTRGLRRLLFETFDRGERTKAIWAQVNDERRRAALRDNLYYLTVKVPDLSTWYTWDRDLGNTYNIELSVAFQTVGAPAAVGIAFDVQPDANSVLLFEITNDKRWQFSTFVNGEFVPERSTQLIPEDIIVDGNGTNTLWVMRTPNEIQLWINSKHVATVSPGVSPGGRAGVAASSFSSLTQPATMIVDNFLARAP
jgi:serine/threonine protein kinase